MLVILQVDQNDILCGIFVNNREGNEVIVRVCMPTLFTAFYVTHVISSFL